MAKQSYRNEDSDIDTNAWLTTYGDMITLLMCFFVIFFSISEVNLALFEELKNGFESDITNKETKSPISVLAEQLDSIYDNPVDDDPDVEVDLLKRGINIRLASKDLFKSGEAQLSQSGRKTVDDISNSLLSIVERYSLTCDIEGHTDDTPIRSYKFPSNWELSASRAANVLRQMIDSGIPKDQSRAIGFADIRPIIEPRDSTGSLVKGARAANRRVEIVIHY
ncbi:MAG: flagellar motor protein MotB [Bacteroidetes bacterium]|nr:flagellar motor protein MotB [Bacteroidota bacterium]